MSFEFTDSIIRQKEARRVYEELRNAAAQTNQAQALKKISPEADAVLRANQQTVQDSGVSQLVDEMGQTIQDAPVFSLILAAYPYDAFLKELGGWFRGEIHAHSLLKIRVRRSIGGGVVIQSKNQIFDHSFRPYLLDNKSKIPEVVRNV